MLSRLDLRGDACDLAVALMHTPVADEVSAGDVRGDVRVDVPAAVAAIIDEVQQRGDDALRSYTQQFDGVALDDLRVHRDELQTALDNIDPDLRAALEFARDQILAYHESQREHEAHHERSGVRVRELILPVDRAGLYVPGGRADYPSTVLMTAIPARVAGVPEVVLCVPPNASGMPPQATLAAAALAGVDEVYRVGGAQAIAAMAFGTESIRPVDVIVGPGNAFVAEAKRQVIGQVGIDSIAGPSELVVIADDSSNPQWVAADLLAQAEHGPGGSAVVVTWSEPAADAIDAAVAEQTARSLRQRDIASTLASGGRCILVDSPQHAMDVSNHIAPEHLQLMSSNAADLIMLVRNAGAVFVGAYAPAVIGDYVAGVNHVLPTGGTARFSSALRVADFQKHIHVVELDDEALRRVGPFAATIADSEGLDAHAQSIRRRGLFG